MHGEVAHDLYLDVGGQEYRSDTQVQDTRHQANNVIELRPGVDHQIQLHQEVITTPNPLPKLTDIERQSLYYQAIGHKAMDITRLRGVQTGIFMKSIYSKYRVNDTTKAISLAIRHNELNTDQLAKEFDFSIINELNDTQINILRELTVIDDSNEYAAVGKRIGITKDKVASNLKYMYDILDLRAKTRATAFYLLAVKQGLLTDDQVEFYNLDQQPRYVNLIQPRGMIYQSPDALPHDSKFITEDTRNEEPREALPYLTSTESNILFLVAKGLTIRSIASKIRKSERTVKARLQDVYDKYGVTEATQAISLAIRHKAISDKKLLPNFDFVALRKLNRKQIILLSELTNTEESTSNAAIGKRVGLSMKTIEDYFTTIFQTCNLQSRTHAAAFFVLAEAQRLVPKRVFDKKSQENKSNVPKLSETETTVLISLAKGLNVNAMARAFNCSENTIKNHIKRIYKKYRVNNVAHAVSKGLKLEEIPIEEIANEVSFDNINKLSTIQVDILRELSDTDNPNSGRDIAKRLGLDHHTVRYHMRIIYRTQGLAPNPALAAAFYITAKKKNLVL